MMRKGKGGSKSYNFPGQRINCKFTLDKYLFANSHRNKINTEALFKQKVDWHCEFSDRIIFYEHPEHKNVQIRSYFNTSVYYIDHFFVDLGEFNVFCFKIDNCYHFLIDQQNIGSDNQIPWMVIIDNSITVIF